MHNPIMPRHLANFPLVSRPYANVMTPTDPYGDVKVTPRTIIVDLKPWNGISEYRDRTTLVSGGAVTPNTSTGEITLTTAASATSSAILTSKDYSTYETGTGLDATIGIRMPSANLTGTQFARWGLYDGTNGVYVQLSSTGLSIVTLRTSTATPVARASWNIDQLDGTGPSAYDLDLTQPLCFRFNYSLCGHGNLVVSVICTDSSDGTQMNLPIHAITPNATTGTTINTPCLPIRVELSNGGTTAASASMQVGVRSVQILGLLRPMIRFTHALRDGTVTVSNTAFTFLMGIRKRAAGNTVRCTLRALEVISSSRIAFVQIVLNPTLTAGTWITPTYQTATHTVLETNISATGFTGGTTIFSGAVDNAVPTKLRFTSDDDVTLATGDTWMIAARCQVGTGAFPYTSAIFSEEW